MCKSYKRGIKLSIRIAFLSLVLAGCDNSGPSSSVAPGEVVPGADERIASDQSEILNAIAFRTAQCAVVGDTLSSARNGYAQQCSGTPRDCDPTEDSQWMCSNVVIGDAAPQHTLGILSGDMCSVTASTLGGARQRYGETCTLALRDCDPVGDDWMCSSEVIGTASPFAPIQPTFVAAGDTPASGDDSSESPVFPGAGDEEPLAIESPFVEGLTIAAQWNELALAAVRSGSARPTVTTWQMFVLSAAMYDAIAVYSAESTPYALNETLRRPASEHSDANRQEAASQAAYQALLHLFPDFESDQGFFGAYLDSLGYAPTAQVNDSASSLGYQAAVAVLQARASDGSNSANDFEPITSFRYPELYVPVNSPDPISDVGIFGENFDPNAWQPLRVPNGTVLNDEELAVVDNLNINSFGDQEFLTSHWGAVTPFALSFASEFRPSGPPLLNSYEPYTDALGVESSHDAAYRRQIDEVLDFSATLTDTRKVIAEFWADGPRTESPPGHWNQIAHGVVERDKLSLVESTHLFFALNGALLDAGIATWETKRFYNYIRPASAIRFLFQNEQIKAWGGPNRGTVLIPGSDWSPYQSITFVTPPFPEFVSGHSTFSRAAAEVLTRYTGSDQFYDGVTRTLQDVNNDGELDILGEHIARAGTFFIEEGPVDDVVLQWPTFRAAADEAGKSRLYGGIHIQDGDLRGRELGEKVGISAFDRAMAYINGQM